ncbi:MAG: hypothetical protein HOK99_03745 [Betaproteobacteria bacterium]|mgnify:FL=1|jgi:hypothetical protein|nr:hypothetical protein [Betaproteobacteria bacterium]
MKNQYLPRALILIVLLAVVSYTRAWAAEPLQTQMSMSGDMDVDVLKASILDNIFTVVLVYRNNGKAEERIYYDFAGVYFIDDTEKKKYHVLKDSNNKWIGAPMNSAGDISRKIAAGGKQLVWFKFPAPPATVKSINLVIPGVLPFEELAVSR